MNISLGTILVGTLLILLQAVAALPWIAVGFFTREERSRLFSGMFSHHLGRWLLNLGIAVLFAALLATIFGIFVQDASALETCGKLYGALLQVQLIADFFIVFFVVLLKIWPKGGAVAQAAFREGLRQPMFWLVVGLALVFMTVLPFWPYFTFGEDLIMMKDLGYDTVMLAGVLFGVLAASLSITEEIEGRTAVTLMSKPVSRRQFLLGKYLGIILASLVIFGILGTYFEGTLLFKRWFDRLDVFDPGVRKDDVSQGNVPPWVTATLARLHLPGRAEDFLRGTGLWTAHSLESLPGLVLGFSQVLVLVALAVALATRVPMVVNLATVIVVYVLGHLAPVLVATGDEAQRTSPGAVSRLLSFTAHLFDNVLPALDSFRLDSALVSDSPPPPGQFMLYVGSTTLYALAFTLILLLLGLILFEDRDLA
jgi:ABC-type transport system involved in multi-copper enzyme maturation permease subunit